MSIVVNTNLASLQIQTNLANATSANNTSMLRMSTGSKINSAADDAAGLAVATGLTTSIRGSKVASSNAQLGSSLLTTSEGTLTEIQSNLSRIRDLTEQAANGTYGSSSIDAIKTEVKQRALEINRLSKVANFNGTKLFDSSSTAGTSGLRLQVGTGADADTTDVDKQVNTIVVDKEIFKDATVSALKLFTGASTTAQINTAVDTAFASAASINTFLGTCDTAIGNVTNKETLIGAYQNRITSAVNGLTVQKTNLTSARSLIQDADIAEESSNYVQSNILKQASASLLTQANQAPSIAVNLV